MKLSNLFTIQYSSSLVGEGGRAPTICRALASVWCSLYHQDPFLTCWGSGRWLLVGPLPDLSLILTLGSKKSCRSFTSKRSAGPVPMVFVSVLAPLLVLETWWWWSFLVLNQTCFSPHSICGRIRVIKSVFAAEPAVISLSCDFIHSLVIESKQRPCWSVGPLCRASLWSRPVGSLGNLLVHFSKIWREILEKRGVRSNECRGPREMVNFHTLRTLLYSRHQLKAYSPSEGEQASCKEICVQTDPAGLILPKLHLSTGLGCEFT